MAKKTVSKKTLNQVLIYQAKNGAIELRGDSMHDTLWATQAQIATLFNIERSVVTKHIGSVLNTGEVDEKSNVQKMHIANSDKPVAMYSLDVILSVGYRSNSARAIDFRRWASRTLREYLVKGYTINRKQIAKNREAFLKDVESVQALLPEHIALDPKAILELVKVFTNTWMSLDAYDKNALVSVGTSKKAVRLSSTELTEAISSLRTELPEEGRGNGHICPGARYRKH